jgi:hypothetical protein
MGEDRSRGHDCPNGSHWRLSNGDGVRFLLRGEEQILQSITAGAPLPELLNRICGALDCEIGNVVSLVSLLDEDAADFPAMAGSAKHFGLHMFCSIGVISENCELLGTLEMYACEPWSPSSQELEIIKRAGCLAAIAIERGNGPAEDDNGSIEEMRLIRKQMPDLPETLN